MKYPGRKIKGIGLAGKGRVITSLPAKPTALTCGVIRYVVAAAVRGVYPDAHDRSGRGIPEALGGLLPAGMRPGRLGVPAAGQQARAALGGPLAAGFQAALEVTGHRQLGEGVIRFVGVAGSGHDGDAAAQLVEAQPPGGVMLAEDGEETLPFLIADPHAAPRR